MAKEAAAGSCARDKQGSMCLPPQHVARNWKGPSLAIPTPKTTFVALGLSNVGIWAANKVLAGLA